MRSSRRERIPDTLPAGHSDWPMLTFSVVAAADEEVAAALPRLLDTRRKQSTAKSRKAVASCSDMMPRTARTRGSADAEGVPATREETLSRPGSGLQRISGVVAGC